MGDTKMRLPKTNKNPSKKSKNQNWKTSCKIQKFGPDDFESGMELSFSKENEKFEIKMAKNPSTPIFRRSPKIILLKQSPILRGRRKLIFKAPKSLIIKTKNRFIPSKKR